MTFAIGQVVFWVSVGLLGYVYLGYPILVWLVGRLFPREVEIGNFAPHVTVLITAFNEAGAIRRKIENTLALDYPAEKLEILVASDGSTDETDDLVRSFQPKGVKLFRQEGRAGKTITQNNAVGQASGEIILFSDATTMYEADSLKSLLPAFADGSVGCVAGRLIYVDEARSNVGTGARGYWSYETLLKMAESRACSLIGASGCLYAVRRSAYEPMYAEACSDFLISSVLYRKGLRTVFEPAALCYEETNRDPANELKMRIRVILQTYTDLWRNRDMLNPLNSGFFAVELFSHKLLRYAVPLLLLVLFFANATLALTNDAYFAVFAAQVVFYLMAMAGWAMEHLGRPTTLLAMPLYFVLANFAPVVAFYKFLRGERLANWETVRNPQ